MHIDYNSTNGLHVHRENKSIGQSQCLRIKYYTQLYKRVHYIFGISPVTYLRILVRGTAGRKHND